MTREETANLVMRLQEGDEEAFCSLFAAYGNKAVRTAALISGDTVLAEDIVQEAFVICLHQIKKLKNPHCFWSWFLKILTRCAWKMAKEKGHLVLTEDILEKAEAFGTSETDIYPEEERSMYDALYHAIEGLGKKQRATVILYYFNDLSIGEIAQVTSSLEGTVKSRLFAAKKRLRAVLEKKEGDFYETT